MSLFLPDTSFFDNYYDKARYLLAWRVSLVFIPIFIVTTFFYSFTSLNAAFPSFVVLLVGVFCLLFLFFTKKYQTVFWFYAISGTVISQYAMNTVFELTHYVDFMWVTICIFLAFIGLGRKVGITFIIINAFLILYFYWFTLNRHIAQLKPRTTSEMAGESLEMLFALFILGYLIHQYFLFQQFAEKELKIVNTELEVQNQLITAKNNENIILIKEIHHRVKNNLQIITSLLRLQKQNLSADVQEKFDESISRVMTMALIHRKLYQSTDLSNVNLESYINDLVTEIFNSLSFDENVKTHIESNYNHIGLNTIVPLGLLLNELLSNSFKHAFRHVAKSEISIQINKLNDNTFELKYSDTGSWKNPTEDQYHFGLELIETLTEQMEGEYTRDHSSYTFTLKNLDI